VASGARPAGAAPGPSDSAPAPYGTRLADAAETVRQTIALGVRNGISQARIQLSPASLGAIQIRLQRSADGIVARVTTDRPEAAATLRGSSDDLRRSLEAGGAKLLRLDISSSDRQDTPTQRGFTGSAPDRGGRSAGAAGQGAIDDPDAVPELSDLIAMTTLSTLSGATLVDVLA
jgi:flagellar hook-length control protein FliK